MNRRRAAMLFLLLLGAALVLCRVTSATPPAAPPEPAPPMRGAEPPAPTPPQRAPAAEGPPRADSSSVFGEWLALGSGCRARSSEPGNVTMERLAFRRGDLAVQRARFHIDGLRLTGADRPADRLLSFARECAIRVQIGPPPGQRLVDVTARTRVISSKSEGLKLTLSAALRLGAARIAHQLVEYEAAESHQNQEDRFKLSPTENPDDPFPSLSCAAPKLIGFDYTWIAEPTGSGSGGDVSVELAGDAEVVDVDATLAACP
jgi:hypothetical protein